MFQVLVNPDRQLRKKSRSKGYPKFKFCTRCNKKAQTVVQGAPYCLDCCEHLDHQFEVLFSKLGIDINKALPSPEDVAKIQRLLSLHEQ